VPTRSLPQRAWAAALPTLLTHQGFELMLSRPSNHIVLQHPDLVHTYSHLERFFGSTQMRRQCHKPIEEHFKVQLLEPYSITFNNESMQFKISHDTITMDTIHLWVSALDMNQWNRDELDTIQLFFEKKVACAPYNPNAFMTFARALTVPSRILKDFIRLWKLDLYPDPSVKWILHFCCTIPPCGTSNPGMSACLIMKMQKILIFIQLSSRSNIPNQSMNEPLVLTVPMIYDLMNNSIQVLGDSRSYNNTYGQIMNVISNMLKRFNEVYNHEHECIIYPAIREVMTNLQYPIMNNMPM